MLFDLRALGYFVAAYETGGITAAARRCHVAQPSISMAIKGLEDVLGSPLFVRGRSGLAPTPAGERLYPRACGLLAQADAMVRDFRDAPREVLGLHLPDDVLLRSAMPLLAWIDTHWPAAAIHLTATPGEARLRLVADHCKAAGDLFESVLQEPYVMLVPERHPLRIKARFGLADLHGIALIARPYCPLHERFARLAAQQGVTFEVRASAAREEALLQMVELGLGLAVVPRSHAAHAPRCLARPLDAALPFARHLGLACAPEDAALAPALARMAAALRGQASPAPGHAGGPAQGAAQAHGAPPPA